MKKTLTENVTATQKYTLLNEICRQITPSTAANLSEKRKRLQDIRQADAPDPDVLDLIPRRHTRHTHARLTSGRDVTAGRVERYVTLLAGWKKINVDLRLFGCFFMAT